MRAGIVSTVLILIYGLDAMSAAELAPCRIDIVDHKAGTPVPLVELRTVSGIRLVSDNAGVIACDIPEIMGRETWFHVIGHGYGVEADGFGYEGIKLTPQRGASLRVKVRRRMIAERVGRLTGSGLLAESARVASPSVGPVESGVVGCDSVQAALHNGAIFWLWGDTSLPEYPLGVFHATGATTAVDEVPHARSPLTLRYNYFRGPDQRPRGIANIPGRGPTWLTALSSVTDDAGAAHLVALYMKIDPPLSVWQWGVCEWNTKTEMFEPMRVVEERGAGNAEVTSAPQGHVSRWQDGAGKNWLLVGNPFPKWRLPDSLVAFGKPEEWEAITSTDSLESVDGERVQAQSGDIAWSAYRKKWIALFTQSFGAPSTLGEVWYAEADSPLGPYGKCVKVLTHQNYTFYNPRIDTEFSGMDSRYLYFEGTYTTMFAGAGNKKSLTPDYPQPTPRYDYNQILYRIDLDDHRLQGSDDAP